MSGERTTHEWKAEKEHYRRDYAKHIACKDVPTAVLETVRVVDLLDENEALRALLREWFVSGATPQEGLVERTHAVLDR